MELRTTFVETAAAALDAIDHDTVRAAWSQSSALEEMTVGALAAHLARAVLTVERYLQGEAPTEHAALTDPAGYLTGALPDTAADTETNRAVRARAEQGAADGPDAVLDSTRRTLARLRERLPQEPELRRLAVLDGIAMLLDDYLATRLVELVVHLDDLDASVEGLTRPELPMEAEAIAVGVLAETARRRSSTRAMVAALARRERAGDPPPRAF